MAEVKQASGSFSLSMKKKPPSFSSNGVGASFKHIYDDVFASPPSSNLKSSISFVEDDYAEIFGSSKSNNGSWNLSYSSVPILDVAKEQGLGSSKGGEGVDYGRVFGGVDSSSFGMPDGEELFDQLKKKAKTSAANNLPRSQGQATEATSPEISNQSYDGQSPTNGFCNSFDNMKHFEPRNNKVTVNATSSRPGKAAHIRAYSLLEVSDTQNTLSGETPVIKDDMLHPQSNFGKKLGRRSRHTSLDLGANKQSSNGDAELRNESGMSRSNSVDAPHACQLSKAATNGCCQSSDNTKHSEYKINEESIERTSGETHTPDVDQIRESNNSSHELGHTQETLSSKTSVLNDETRPEVNLAKEQEKHSRNTSLDLGSKQNDKYDAVFQKACGLSESTSVDASHETCDASVVAGPSNVVKDDAGISSGCDEGKKKGRRSRMTSIDLGDYKHSSERDDGLKRKPRLGGSYSFDASHDPCAARVKVQPSKMYPSSSLPQFFPVESRYKITENSSCKRSQKNLCGGAGGSPPSLAEELDVNSAAAVSAAALQRAIEEAEMRIQLAKAFLVRQGQGSTNMRFKDTLKVKVAKENGLVNERNKFKQPKMHEYCPPIDRELRPCSPLERKHVVEISQGSPVSEDEKMFVKDEKLAEGKNTKVSSSIRGDDKREGGEWEAAKHLNQLISGVKNRLASFMSWQTENEKKDPKETEASMKRQQHPEEVVHNIEDHESFKRKRTEQNQGTSISSCEAMYGENKIHLASEAVDAEENGLIRSFNVKQEKAENKLNSIPDTAGPSSTNFQFFAFRNQRLCDFVDPEVEEKKGPHESRESEIASGQEQVINKVKIEHIPCQGEEVRREKSDDKCVTEDCKRQEDTYRTSDIGFSDEENDMTVEEPCPLAGHDKKELSHEEDRQGDRNRMGDIYYTNGENAEMVEEHYLMVGQDKKKLTEEEKEQDYMSRMSHLGCINEENDEIVKQPFSLDGLDENGLTHDEDRQDDLYRNSHLGSSNEEYEEIVKELCTQALHERNVSHVEDNDRSPTEEFGEELMDQEENTAERTNKDCEELMDEDENTAEDGECKLLKEAKSQHENVEVLEENNLVGETWKNFSFTNGVYDCQEIERNQRETNHIEEVSGRTHGCEDIKQIQNQTHYIEETSEKVTVQASCVASADEGCKQNENVILTKVEEACRIVESSSKVQEAVYPDEESERMMDITNTLEPEMDILSRKASELFGEEPLVSAQKASELIGDEPPVSAQKTSELNGEEPPVSAQKASDLIGGEPVLSSISSEHIMKLDRDGIEEGVDGTIGTLQHEITVSLDSEIDMSSREKDVDVKAVDPESLENLENQTEYLHESGGYLHVGEFDTTSNQDAERSSVEAVHRRRRWFDNGGSIATPERPNILEGHGIDSEMDQEVLDESELAGSVEIHSDKLDCSAAEVTTAKVAEVSSTQDDGRTNVETTPTRRRWFVQRGQGLPEPVSLFEDIKVNLDVSLESMNESLLHNISGNCLDELNTKSGEILNAVKSDVAINGEKGKQSGEVAPRRKRWFESGEKVGPGQQGKSNETFGLSVDIDQESKATVDAEELGKLASMSIPEEKDDVHNKVKQVKEHHIDPDEANRREKEKEKEKIAVERAIREARERAFAEARERARRDAADRPNVEACQRVAAGAQEKLGKASSEATSFSDKIAMEAKLKAERAAVERATAEARERALQKALSEKASQRSREQGGRYSSEKNSSLEPKHQSSKCSDSSNNSENFEGVYVESSQRRKARLDRQTRTMERAAKALEEKNRRDLLALKEQAAKNMLADSLDAEVKRWSVGKEGNLRALLSTLQYVLGPDSGWQPVSLTDLVAATAVRKAYKKATLCVHPDKLQQRGATIQQKYICEKVFDLLKDAWSKFNPDER